VGRGAYSRIVDTANLGDVANDPLFQVSTVLVGLRLRFLVWGTAIDISGIATVVAVGGDADVVRCNVTPGAGHQSVAVASLPASSPEQQANTFADTFIGQSAVSVPIVAPADAVLNTHGVVLFNQAAADLFIRISKNGAVASAVDSHYRIPANTAWEMPFPFWLLAIDGIWAAAGGAGCRVLMLRRA
jgi:hypothetical protein